MRILQIRRLIMVTISILILVLNLIVVNHCRCVYMFALVDIILANDKLTNVVVNNSGGPLCNNIDEWQPIISNGDRQLEPTFMKTD